MSEEVIFKQVDSKSQNEIFHLSEEQMKSFGIYDYYRELKIFIYNYLNENFIITNKTMNKLSKNEISFELYKRKLAQSSMLNTLTQIIKKELKRTLPSVINNKSIPQRNEQEYKESLIAYKSEILNNLNLVKSNQVCLSEAVYDNKDNLKSALIEGISAEAIQAVLNDLMNNTNDYVPKQFTTTVESISNLKSSEEKTNIKYSSKLMNEKGSNLKNAMEQGITPKELQQSFNNKINNSDHSIKFDTKLVSKAKAKELVLKNKKEMENTKVKQLVKVA